MTPIVKAGTVLPIGTVRSIENDHVKVDVQGQIVRLEFADIERVIDEN